MKHEHLPEGWRWVRFDEIAYNVVERNGNNPERTVMAVTKYDGLVPSLEYFDRQVYSDDISNYKVVRPNQFAYAVIHLDEGSIGMNDSDEPILVSPVYVVFGLDERKAAPEYFRFLLKSDYMMMTYQRIGEGTVDRRKSITFETLGSAQVPLPSLDEQRRITELLYDANANIAHVEAQITAAQEVKCGVMHRLFTYGLAGANVETTALRYSKVPATWIMNTYEDLCSSITVGIVQQPKQYYQPDGVPALRSANVLEGSIILGDMVYISEEANMLHQKSILHEGDIVTVRTGYPGTSCVVPTEYDGANCIDLIVSRIKNDINPFFLAAWINSDHGKYQVLVGQGGGAQQHFNVGELRKMKVAYPPDIDEQREIVAILNAHDATIRNLQAEAASLREVKRGLMQKLLSGQVRV